MSASDPSDDSMDKYQIQSDADTMQKHAEITADPDRHAKAHQELQSRVKTSKAAVKNSAKGLSGRVKKGLNKAFPDGKTPFDKAGENTESQGQKAESD